MATAGRRWIGVLVASGLSALAALLLAPGAHEVMAHGSPVVRNVLLVAAAILAALVPLLLPGVAARTSLFDRVLLTLRCAGIVAGIGWALPRVPAIVGWSEGGVLLLMLLDLVEIVPVALALWVVMLIIVARMRRPYRSRPDTR